MVQQRFVHLRVHSEYSIIDSLIQVSALTEQVLAKDMTAVALTDFCNFFAAVKFYQAAISVGIKPILGCDIPYHYPHKPEEFSSMILLCQNETGYRHLTQLISKAYQEGQFQGQPRIHIDWIKDYAQGLIALSGGQFGDIGRALLAEEEGIAYELANQWKTIFPGRFYLEIQRTGRSGEEFYNQQIIKMAEVLQLPLVATNDVRFFRKEDYEAHEARICINRGCLLADSKRRGEYSPQQYLRSAEEMTTLFHDLPQALQNTVEISKRCTVILDLGHNYLPKFTTPNSTSADIYLSQLAAKGLEKRLEQLDVKHDNVEPYAQRLQLELNVINSMGFADYFLIVADFIQWAKQNKVPVGPGRGSGAGSLVAYVLNITDLDPLHYDLLFERFLNPERVSMPDFDIDFCMEGRDKVIEYVAEKYGRQSVSQIITFGTMAAKAVVRDVGRVLGHPYGFVDKLAKLIPFALGITLKQALEQEEELKKRYESEDDVKELIDLALKLEGLTRNAGKHAGGVVIAPSQLTDFTAIYCEEGSTQIVSQFDKDDVEAVGLVKFDFLGLRTLTIIQWTIDILNQHRLKHQLTLLDISHIPTQDEPTFQLLKACQTTAVFQLESRGMKELIHRLQPDCFEDIIALVALFRPGPLQSGMVDDFIDRKHGRAKVEYLHPDLEPILKPTYGVILYQEQVMQIAQVLANYTLGAADLLRRAMGKKKPEEMAKQRAIFVEGARARCIDSSLASTIFDLMEKFAGYGFNKSHSAAYALVAYQTAWLKAHYPAAFMAAVLSSDMDNTDKVVNFMYECKQMGLSVLPPAINDSVYAFTVKDDQTLIYGLGAIKGVGESAIQAIVEARAQGELESLFDLCRRVDARKMNRRVLEALIKSGAMDGWGIPRSSLLASIDKAIQAGMQFHLNQQSGQQDLFSVMEEDMRIDDYIDQQPWSTKMRLEAEKEALGLYLTGHPAATYQEELAAFITPFAKLNAQNSKKVIVCGLITQVRRLLTKRGKKIVILGLEDATGHMDIVVFAEIIESQPNVLVIGDILLVEGELSKDDYTGGLKMTALALYRLEEARTRFAKCLALTLRPEDQASLPAIQSVLKLHGGECVVQIRYTNDAAKAAINLAPAWRVSPSEDLLSKLIALLDHQRVELCY